MYDRDFIQAIIEKRFADTDPETIQEDYGATDVQAGNWTLAYLNLTNTVATEIIKLGSELKETKGPRGTFEEWSEAQRIDFTDRDPFVAGVVYDHFLHLLAEKRREERRAREAASPFRLAQTFLETPFYNPEVEHRRYEIERDQEREHWEQIRILDIHVREIAAEIEKIDVDIDHWNHQLVQANLVPSDVRWGLFVLATLGITGIIFPMGIAAFYPDEIGRYGRIGVLGILCSGLVSMFAYVVKLIGPRSRAEGSSVLEEPQREQV